MREITAQDIVNVKRLQKAIEEKLNNCEYNPGSFLGIKNVSVSDLEGVLDCYLPCFETFNFEEFSAPCGNEKKILEKFNLNVWG